MKGSSGLFDRDAASQTEKAYGVLEELIVTGALPPPVANGPKSP
ncbi:hypothetical protein [Paraburkholderia xenovorans]